MKTIQLQNFGEEDGADVEPCCQRRGSSHSQRKKMSRMIQESLLSAACNLQLHSEESHSSAKVSRDFPWRQRSNLRKSICLYPLSFFIKTDPKQLFMDLKCPIAPFLPLYHFQISQIKQMNFLVTLQIGIEFAL